MGRDAYPWYRAGKRCWYVYAGGKQVRLSPDKAEAFRLWHEMQGRPDAGEMLPALVGRYVEARKASWKQLTLECVRRTLDTLPADDAATLDVCKWLDSRPWNDSTRRLAVAHLRGMLKWAGIDNPTLKAVRVRPMPSRGRRMIITPAEHKAISGVVSDVVRDALAILYATGCRPSELRTVTAARVVRGVIAIDEHKADAGGKVRLVVLAGEAKEVVVRLCRDHPTGPLLRGRGGVGSMQTATIRVAMRKACLTLGIPRRSPYCYRHTFATDALARGVPDSVVAALLGHSSTAMVHKHYGHLSERLQALKEAADRARPDAGG